MSFFGEIEEFFNDPIGYTGESVEAIGSNLLRIVGEGVTWLVEEFTELDFNTERNILLNKESNVAQIPVVYGRRKIGGTRVAVGLSSDKKDLYIVLAMCEGEIQEIESVYINDIISTDSRFSGKVTINQYLGTDSQTADSMLTTAFPTLWTSNHRLRGIAYLACKFVYDPEVFRSIPEITAIVKGRKVYDPRNTTTAYSDNPALCLLDYLTNSRYGKGLSLSDIDTTAFGNAATDCEELVTKYTGAPVDTEIFTCNAVLPTDKTIFDNVKVLLSGMRGLLPYQNGKYGLRIEQDETSVMSFDTDNMVGSVSIQFLGKQRRYNKVTARFVNPEANWQGDTVVWPPAGSTEESTFLTEDDGFELSTEINLPTCTDFYAARDLARLVCLSSRNNNYAVSFVATSDAIKLEAGDIIDITYDTPNWSSQKFRVNEIQINADGTIGISAQKHDSTIYPWDTSTEFTDLGDFGEITQYAVVDPPTNLSVSSSLVTQPSNVQEVSWSVSWTASDALNLVNYEVQWKKTSDSTYSSTTTTDTSISGVGGVISAQSYDVQVRAITSNSAKSDWVTTTHTMVSGMTTFTDGADGDSGSGTYRHEDSSSQATLDALTSSQITAIFDDADVANRLPVIGDLLVLRGAGDAVRTVEYDGSSWATRTVAYIDGSLIVDGTVSAQSFTTSDLSTNVEFGVNTNETAQAFAYGGSLVSYPTPNYIRVDKDADSKTVGWTVYAESRDTKPDKIAIAGIAHVPLSEGSSAGGAGGYFAWIDGSKLLSTNYTNQVILSTSDVAAYFGGNVAIGDLSTSYTLTLNGVSVGSGGGGISLSDLSVSTLSASGAGSLSYNNTNGVFTFRPAQKVNQVQTTGENVTTFRNIALTDGTDDIYWATAGNITAQTSSGTVYANSFNWGTGSVPFTAGHLCLIPDTITPEQGDILVDTGTMTHIDVYNAIADGALSSSPNQKTAMGIFTQTSTFDDLVGPFENWQDANIDDTGKTWCKTNGLGEGLINVCNEGGNIEAGDLIVTSSMAGKGMRQSDDIIRNYTVAKAREAVTFSSASDIRQIACIYLCG